MDKTLTKEQAKDKALNLLSFRAHSEKELCEKLLRAGAEPEDISSVIEFLKEYHFIDDLKYACSKAQELFTLKKMGRRRIAADLKFRGISDEYIEEALSLLDDNEAETLLPLVRKKLGGDFEKKSIDRTIRYFSARGYNFEDIKKCIDDVKNEF